MNSARIAAFALLAVPYFSRSASGQENFLARFETDAQGTWLVYPSTPGWHYTVQYSTDFALNGNAEVHFEDEPDGFGYGTGGDLRFFVSPQLVTPSGGGGPPTLTNRFLNAGIRVSRTPNDARVQVTVPRADETSWSILAPQTLPRDNGCMFFRWQTPTESWLLSLSVLAVDGNLITATEGPGILTGDDAANWQLIADRWNDIIAHLNRPNAPQDEPEPGPPGAAPQRRFLRVIKQATDSNGNGIPDWWELQYGYAPFSVSDESGFLGQNNLTDSDGDGINNYTEGRCGLNPNDTDSDDDGIGDILEDSDADGAINQSEVLNRSQLWNPDTDDDGLPDGDDWFELVDSTQTTPRERRSPVDFEDPELGLPDIASRNAWRLGAC